MFSTSNVIEQRLWLIALLTAWAALLFGGFLLGRLARSQPRRMLKGTHLLSSLVLVVAAWSLHGFTRGEWLAGFTRWIAVGMALCFIGDLFMARVLPAPDRVIAGMAVFGLGHIAYIAAGLAIRRDSRLDAAAPFAAAWAAWLLAGLLGWYLFVLRPARSDQAVAPVRLIALPYAFLLSSTAGVATGLALQEAAFLPFALGAAFLLFSDALIAADLFSDIDLPGSDDLVWLTYGPGTMLVVFGAAVLR